MPDSGPTANRHAETGTVISTPTPLPSMGPAQAWVPEPTSSSINSSNGSSVFSHPAVTRQCIPSTSLTTHRRPAHLQRLGNIPLSTHQGAQFMAPHVPPSGILGQLALRPSGGGHWTQGAKHLLIQRPRRQVGVGTGRGRAESRTGGPATKGTGRHTAHSGGALFACQALFPD